MTDKTVTPSIEMEVSIQQNGTPIETTETAPIEKHHKTNRKKVGIFMDHSNATLIGYSNNPTETTSIESAFTHEVKEQALSKSENIMHNKEQHQQKDFYKKLRDAIKDYDEVLLFGPTSAKTELANILKSDHHFEKIEISIKPADKMTENQQHAFVNEHFSNK